MQTAHEQNMNFCSEEIDLLKQEVVQLTSSSLAVKLSEMHALACVYMRSVMYVHHARTPSLICVPRAPTKLSVRQIGAQEHLHMYVRSLGRHSFKQ